MAKFKAAAAAMVSAALALSAVSFTTAASAEEDYKGIVLLHTNDVHCGINADDTTFGYADVAAYRAKLEAEGYKTILIDAGDFAQGDVIGTLSDGEYIVDIMNNIGYDIAVPGNHEFDYGMEQFNNLMSQADFDVICANFKYLPTGETVFDGCKLVEVGDVKIGFVGIATPESITKSTPAYFQNENGEYIYGFCSGNNGQELYDAVQESVDEVIEQGADIVVAIGHLGIDPQSSPWMSTEVIANTTGIDVMIDAHSHSVIDGDTVAAKDGEQVLLTSTGTKLNYIGTVTIDKTGVSTKLISKSDYTVTTDVNTAEYKAYKSASDFISGIEAQYNELVNTVVAKTDVTLTVMSPDDPEVRIVRSQETNLADLCADAYRTLLGADIAFVNGGGVRANIEAGDITYGQIIAVHPFGNMACMIEATGQQILDALELGAAYTPDESGGFLQVSGLTYEIHTYIPSSVVLTDNKEFIKVDGEYRVKNVMVNGEPLDLNKTYKLASHNYMLKSGGDGYTMFKGDNLLLNEVLIDNQVLINYIVDELNGVVGEEYANPLGDGRITIYAEAPAADDSGDYNAPVIDSVGDDNVNGLEDVNDGENVDDDDNENPKTGTGSAAAVIILAVAAGTAMLISRRRK